MSDESSNKTADSNNEPATVTPLIFWTSLASDAMYFHAACRALEHARSAKAAVDEARRRWKVLEDRESRAVAADDHNEMERIAIQMVENASPRIDEAYGPFIEALATVHIMTASALEAHINEQAEELPNRIFDIFDRLTIEGKWLFLPKLLQWPRGFDCGSQPFQDFSLLVKRRNGLVHHKSRRVKTEHGQPPKFLADLGLTLEHAEHSVQTTKNMLRELANIRSQRPPYWIDRNDYKAFKWELDGLDLRGV